MKKNNIDYIIGIGANIKLQKLIQPLVDETKKEFETFGKKQQLFTDFYYSAKFWNKQRRIIAKAEYNHQN